MKKLTKWFEEEIKLAESVGQVGIATLLTLKVGQKLLVKATFDMEYRLLEAYVNKLPKTYRKSNCNWVIAQEFLQYKTSKQGSTSSIEKCIDLGIDPDGYTLERIEVSHDN